jgi:hypothetical protein
MQSLSTEQEYILNKIKENKNVIVDAVAGTGKTTLILAVAKELSNKKILQMTYNSSLRLEVKSKVLQYELENIRVHTFHSLAKRFYKTNDFTTDTEIRAIINKNQHPKDTIPIFDILVLDECQDMTFLYFQFIMKFIRDMSSPIQLLILGDYMQGLYEFKGADIRFLTLAETVWRDFPLLRTQEFQKTTMKMSFRITNQICSFVNQVMLGESRMDACRDDVPVIYIRNSTDNIHRVVSAEIQKLFEKGVQPCDIFILGSSVKGVNSNIRKLENRLVERNIPCHVPMLENEKIDDRVIGGKVVFSTFHCVKGRQRKYVFVVGFDHSYHRFYARTKSPEVCPNTLYVAATRAMNGLYLLENDQYRDDRPLKFLKMNHVEMKRQPFIEFRGIQKTIFQEEPEEQEKNSAHIHYVTPSELIKFIPESIIEEIYSILETIFVPDTNDNCVYSLLEIPNIVETKDGFFEEVSDINGIAIPCMYYDFLIKKYDTENPKIHKTSVLLDMIRSQIANMGTNEHIFLKKKLQEVPENIEKIEEYLLLANIYLAIQETLYFKLKQIDSTEYNWVSPQIIEQCQERMNQVIGADCLNRSPIFEKTFIHEKQEESHVLIDAFLETNFNTGNQKQFRFHARVDLITENTVWEVKCTSKITIEHMLQVVIYKWLWYMSLNPPKEFKIFNIKTGEIVRLEASEEQLHTIILHLLKGKYQENIVKENDEFVQECRSCFYTDKYVKIL